jgi:hypothetical protein
MSKSTTTCARCSGSGYVSPRLSRGCAGDICFGCNGKGIVTVTAARKARAPKIGAYVSCYIAGWIVNGRVRDGACEYYATEDAAIAAAARRPGTWSVTEGRLPASNAYMIRPAA